MKAQPERMVAPAKRRGRVRAANSEAPSPAELKFEGNLDGCTRDGRVTGWCWYPEAPGLHVGIAILVNDTLVGATRAVLFRADLLAAGIGDGTYGFTFALPWSALEQRGLLTIAVRDEANGLLLGPPLRLRLGPLSATEDRVVAMEREIRQLRSEIAELSQALDRRESEGPTQALFATISTLFASLSRAQAPSQVVGELSADVSLHHALAQLRLRHEPFALAVASAPRARIVIPARAPLSSLYRCLLALHKGGIDEQAEIIVLDDGAGPPELGLLPGLVGNLTLFRPEGGSIWTECAEASASPVLVVLSPLLRPEPDWLATLLSTLAAEPEAGLVCGRVVGEDGLLRDLGLRADAEGLPRQAGRLDPADRPEWCYLHEIDAAGALGFAVLRTAFLAAGGLDPKLSLGHAALALCLSLRQAGKRIIVQPHATSFCADHTDLTGWVADLAQESADTQAVRPAWEGRPASPRPLGHALIIDTTLPRVDRDAGSVATRDQLLLLRGLGYRVTFAATELVHADEPGVAELERLGIELVRAPAYGSVTDHLLQHGPGLDLVQVWRHENAMLFLDRVRSMAPRARLIFSPADLHHPREKRARRPRRDAPNEAASMIRAQEVHCITAADATIVHSDAELDLLRGMATSTRLRLLRWIARPAAAPVAFDVRGGIGFVGSFAHSPNEDGLRWFLAQVMPRLRAARPDPQTRIRLHIAGADLPPDLAAEAGPDVVVHGWVEDLADWFATLRLSVAPLRYGVGGKGKVATSLSFGVPVIATGIAIEGTGLADGEGIAIADGAARFATQILRLHDDAAMWQAQQARALERCRELYSPEAAMGVYRGLLADLGLPLSEMLGQGRD